VPKVKPKISHEDAQKAAQRGAFLLAALSRVPCPAKMDEAKDLHLEPQCYIEDFWVQDKVFCGWERAERCWLSYLYGEVVATERFDRSTISGWQAIYRQRNKKIRELEGAITKLTRERDAWKRKCGKLRIIMVDLPELIEEAVSNLIDKKMAKFDSDNIHDNPELLEEVIAKAKEVSQ